MNKYNPAKIESKWQKIWQDKKVFVAKDNSKKTKKYVLVEFPYPSGAGLHMGHLRPYVAGDVYSRYLRMRGHEALYPIGWDAFGLPAENYAIKMGVHPSITTKKNVANAKKQMLSWGLSFDWSREINTTDPDYYKWTQWLFLQFYKQGLAYEATGMINWCPKDKTGLANEEVIDGKCERCGAEVVKKELRQWYLKITAYAEKLLEGLKSLPEWPEAVKLQQKNWIGKSVGAEIKFPLSGQKPNFLLLHGRGSSPEKVFLPWLKKELESRGYKVQVPAMPGNDEPSDLEQANFVKTNCEINEATVILGHSFGGIVAMRLLEQGIKVNKVIFLSTPYTGRMLDGKARKSVVDAIKRGFNFKKIILQANSFVSISDLNDHIVPLTDGEGLAKNTNGIWIQNKSNKPHFDGNQEPTVLEALLPSIKVFTTRPDTIFGATYMVVAPEHPLIKENQQHIENFLEVAKYADETKKKKEMERTAEGKEKTGVELKGLKAVNPATGKEIPVWAADYVLWGYGTGAIMAVPAHDQRDFEFAKKFNLPIIHVVETEKQELEKASVEYGRAINSGKFNGMKTEEAVPKMAEEFGKLTVQYKLRDWVFSRQRYWGEPIPLIHCPACGVVPVPEKDLPVKLPQVAKYEPTGTGDSPLAGIAKWVNVKCPSCKGQARRETNTMPQWAGSSWYWLRYADPKNKKVFADKKRLKYWQPVDVYFGGMEHTTLHLLYSRFWNLFMYDQGLVTEKEPYKKRQPHGIVLAADGEKMSKSRGNVVDPQVIVKKYGADTLRMYEMFLGPHELMVSWNDQGVVGVRRFLDRLWQWAHEIAVDKKAINNSGKAEKLLHKLIKKVTEDIEAFRFNTAISAFMEFHNEIRGEKVNAVFARTFLKLLYPFASHITEELNQVLGGKKSLQAEIWPEYDKLKIIETEVEIVVQVNGKVRGKVVLAVDAEEGQAKQKALELQAVKQVIADSSIKRVIYVKGRLINFVV